MSDDLKRDAYEAVQKHGGLTAAAHATGIPRGTLYSRAKGCEDTHNIEVEKWRESRSRDEWVIECRDTRVRGVDDAIKKAGVDLDLWYVQQVQVNGWDVTMKMKGKDGDVPYRAQNQSIRVVLKRKVPKSIADTIEPLIARLQKHAPKLPTVKNKKIIDPHLLELGLYDAHFGKMAWGKETGTDFDLALAENIYAQAGHDLLAKASSYPIGKIVIPIGQDFFHFCDEEGTTPKSGYVLDIDGRLPKIIDAGIRAVSKLVMHCRETAPVHLLWVPGNHDLTASLWLCKVMRAMFDKDSRVEVDETPVTRKAIRYGVNLLAYHHGDGEKPKDMPAIIMSEQREQLAGVEHIEIHGGHYHRTKAVEHVSVDSFPGDIIYRTLPSLSGRDAWHYRKGYGKRQAAEAYVFSHATGYAGHFSSGVAT